nr:MAG TPA: hypothetical protein [Bacteriophage sp.]DAK77513.1 MAG TPA: hypothetical protein [Caudoviricetes sp.]
MGIRRLGWCDYEYVKKRRAERKKQKKLLSESA